MEPKQDWEKKLEASIGRVEEAFSKNKGSAGKLIGDLIVAAGTEAIEQVSDSLKRKQEERREREERRRRRELEEAAAAMPQGFVFAGATALMLLLLYFHRDLWWLSFVAFGFAMASVSLISKGRQHNRMLREQRANGGGSRAEGTPAALAANPASVAIDARVARVDAVCKKLLAEIKDGPQVVREVIHQPEKTLEALNKACHELARREAELRQATAEQDEERLRSERDALALRIGAERDEVVRSRLGMAFKALEQQLAQRAEIATAASRYEAEGARILYTLESLHTQVLRARSAEASSADLAGAGLRRNLEQLGEEIDAVAEALEAVNRMDLSPVQPISDEPQAAPGTGSRERA